jgi:hypothetical protein
LDHAKVRLTRDPCGVSLAGDDVRPELLALWHARHDNCKPDGDGVVDGILPAL